MSYDRRSVLKGTGAALGVSLLSVAGVAQESEDGEKLNEFEETVTIGPSLTVPLVGPVNQDSAIIEYEPVEGAEEVTATLNWGQAPQAVQDIDLFLYAGSEDGAEVASSTAGQPPAAGTEEITADIDAETTYYIEVRGYIAAQAEVTLTVVERGTPP